MSEVGVMHDYNKNFKDMVSPGFWKKDVFKKKTSPFIA